ncbi:MAG: NYN domain-containing protein [Acidimicrobiia bacterium]
MTDVTLVEAQPTAGGLPRLPEQLLAPLLDVAGEVLRGMAASDVPPALRPVAGFDRRGMARTAARQQLAGALEADESFLRPVAAAFLARSEVRAALDGWSAAEALRRVDEAVERSDLPLLASALYAGRPGGWVFGLGVVCALHDRSRREQEAADDVKAMQTQVTSLDEARRRVQAALEDATADVVRLEEELREERRNRRAREEQAAREADSSRLRAADLEAEVAQERAAIEVAERRAEREAQRARDADAELRKIRTRLAETEDALAAKAAALEKAAAPGTGLRYGDLQALADAAELARRLAQGLSGVVEQARKVAPVEARVDGPQRSEITDGKPRVELAEAERAESVGTARRRRQAPVVPPGMVADSARALDAMLRAPATVFYVDGYNVSKRAWGSDRPADQRERLTTALAALHARTGCDVTVVFDGADVGVAPVARRPGVRVVFSPEDTEADSVIVGEIAALPPRLRVVVASSDGWVREHAEEEGAVVVSASTLLAALRA